MRILHTAATYYPLLDGVAEVARHISERLATRGHNVCVATTAQKSRPADSVISGVRVCGFEISGNGSAGMHGEVDRYRAFVRSGEWDVVVNHCAQIWSTDALRDDLLSYPCPSVLVTHGLSAYNDTTFRTYYREFPDTLRRYAAWVAVTNSAEEMPFAREHGLDPPHVITNGIDTSEWCRKPTGVRQRWGHERSPWIVNVSNHNPNKNHAMLFDLANKLKNSGIHITQIGGSYPMAKWNLGKAGVKGGCYYACRAKAALSGGVELRADIPREQVVSAIQETDLVVATSRWEANSVVLLEAMAAGTPWVSTDVGSARENAGGIVVQSLDEMSGVVQELLNKIERRRNLGEIGQARVREKHTWDAIVDQYEDLYQRVIKQNHERNSFPTPSLAGHVGAASCES